MGMVDTEVIMAGIMAPVITVGAITTTKCISKTGYGL